MTSQWFGDYEIVRQLRVGGMATLHLARRHGAAGFSRLVALKMIHPHLVAQHSFVEMFVDEARICSQISHPNVVHVEEFGVIDGVHYLVMEYLDGCSVGDLLQLCRHERRTLDPELAARVILQIAAGLHAAHATRDHDGQPLEIIHRDISPSNVFLSIDGNAKLIDFGIAKARNRLSETEAGISLKGKYRYVAPEQATRASVDRRCDLFSLGVVFWELLTGQPLFADDTHVGLFNRLHQTDVAAPSTVNPQVPAGLDPIVLAMLEHDPDLRPQTAAEVQRRIASALPGAANRDASELGALAIEVRDRRAAWRASRRTTGESSGSESRMSFSPTPRSGRPGTAADYRIELEPTPPSRVEAPASVTPASVTPTPRGWSARRGVQAGAVALVGVGLVVGLVVGRSEGTAEVRAAPEPRARAELASPALPPRPAATVGEAGPARIASPTSAAAAAAAATAVEAAAQSPSPPASLEAAATTPAAPAAPAAPASPDRGTAAVATGSPPASPPPARRDPGRAVPRPRPARRGGGPVEIEAPARPAAARAVGDRAPFVNVPFDDADNERPAPARPSTAPALKKAPIVNGFDN